MLPDIITKARARLLVRAPFFGSIALGLRWVAAPEVRTMATDGNTIWFCAAWCETHGVEKTMGVIAHEVLHVVNKHHLRLSDRDPELWNVACDLVINRLLDDDKFVLPADGVFDTEKRFARLPAETVYLRLYQQAQKQEQGRARGDHSNVEEADDGRRDQASRNAERKAKPEHDTDGSRNSVAPADRWGQVREPTTQAGRKLTETERRQIEAHLDVRIRQAVAAAMRAGRFGGGLRETVEAALDRVDWRDRFRMLFDSCLRSEASWSRPNRRFVPHGLIMPGWRRAGAGRIAFILDNSGSISAAELAVYVGNLLGLIEETGPEEVTLIQCDTEVRHVTVLGAGETVDQIEVAGRGGTLFQPAFDWIEEQGLQPSMIVYATDLDASDEPIDPGRPVIWLTPTRGRTMPFGEILEITP